MRTLTAVVMTAILALCLAGPAKAEKMSCDDLKQLQHQLVDLDTAIKQEGMAGIKENSDADQALKHMVEALSQVAASEDDPNLSASVENMATAWENLDGDLFAQSVTGAANSLYDIYQRDCN